MDTAAAAGSSLFLHDRKFVSPETYDAFFAVIERLEGTIDSETAALTANRRGALADFTRQKRQGFLELDRISRSMEQAIPSQDIIARLARFRTRLEANGAALQIHLRAVQQVTNLIVKVMRESESDGTYSQAYGRADYDDA